MGKIINHLEFNNVFPEGTKGTFEKRAEINEDHHTITYVYRGEIYAVHMIEAGKSVASGAVSIDWHKPEDENAQKFIVDGLNELPGYRVEGSMESEETAQTDETAQANEVKPSSIRVWSTRQILVQKSDEKRIFGEMQPFSADSIINRSIVVYAKMCENDNDYNIINHYGIDGVVGPVIGPYCPVRAGSVILKKVEDRDAYIKEQDIYIKEQEKNLKALNNLTEDKNLIYEGNCFVDTFIVSSKTEAKITDAINEEKTRQDNENQILNNFGIRPNIFRYASQKTSLVNSLKYLMEQNGMKEKEIIENFKQKVEYLASTASGVYTKDDKDKLSIFLSKIKSGEPRKAPLLLDSDLPLLPFESEEKLKADYSPRQKQMLYTINWLRDGGTEEKGKAFFYKFKTRNEDKRNKGKWRWVSLNDINNELLSNNNPDLVEKKIFEIYKNKKHQIEVKSIETIINLSAKSKEDEISLEYKVKKYKSDCVYLKDFYLEFLSELWDGDSKQYECESGKDILVLPIRSGKDIIKPHNEIQIDHIHPAKWYCGHYKPRSKARAKKYPFTSPGGSNSFCNAALISRLLNNKKRESTVYKA